MELDKIVYIFFLGFFFNFFVIKFRKLPFLIKLNDTEFNKPQAFHKFPAIRSGGITILLLLILFSVFFITVDKSNKYFVSIFLLSILFFIVGFLEDIKINIKAHVRLLVLFISSFFVLYYFDIQILRTQVQFINNIIYSNKFLSILFICLCLIFIVNGCNFIDGFNGLLIIHSLIIFIILYFVNFFNNNNLYIDSILFFFIITLISLAYFNFPIAKIFLGDSGAYIIGIFLSFTSIEIANLNEEISPFFFANLLFYIFFEVIFSFFRKIFYEKTSPFKPDSKHLHMLIFQFIKKKNTSSKLNSNFYTSVVINLVYLILILPSLFYYNDYFFCKTYFFILIIIYLFTYFYIEKKLLFKSKKT